MSKNQQTRQIYDQEWLVLCFDSHHTAAGGISLASVSCQLLIIIKKKILPKKNTNL